MSPLRHLPSYAQIVSMWVQTAYAYRGRLAIELVGLLLRIFLLRLVWESAYAGRAVVDGVPLAQVVTLTTISNLQLYLMQSQLVFYLMGRVRDGQVIFDLMRPAPFLGQLMAHQLGTTLSGLPFLLLATPFALLAGGVQPPASAEAALLYLASLALAYLLTSALTMLVGMLAFWMTEVWALREILAFIGQIFSGALVPLWFFPPAARAVADLLPFQGQAFLPLAIYVGQLSGAGAARALALQLAWALGLGLAAWLLWRRAQRRIVVQGG